ncbi:MAG: hypothetical protein B7X11_00170, partial [Acidobacteria bacterium 37-65-4]
FLLFSFSFGTTYSSKYAGTLPASTAFGSGLYLKAAALAGAVMVMMLAVMYMIGQFFQSEEIKQLARSELLQAVASVLIAACLLGLILFSDVAMEQVSHQIVSPCEGASAAVSGELVKSPLKESPTLNRYAYCYMATLNEMASAQGRTTMLQSLDAAAKAYKSEGFQTDLWWLLYGGMTRRPGAHYRMDSEIHGMEFELLTKYMLSLQAQLTVLKFIIPALGPALLFLGVIFRSLIYTRKLGGMMLAAAAGLLLVWPALYLLSWFTLQVAVYGPQVMGDLPEAGCPASCTTVPPSGYTISANPNGNVWEAPLRTGEPGTLANGVALPYPYAYAKGALARTIDERARLAVRQGDWTNYRLGVVELACIGASLERESPFIAQLVGVAAERIMFDAILAGVREPRTVRIALQGLDATIPGIDLVTAWRQGLGYLGAGVHSGAIELRDMFPPMGQTHVAVSVPSPEEYLRIVLSIEGLAAEPLGLDMALVDRLEKSKQIGNRRPLADTLAGSLVRYQSILSLRRLARLALALRLEDLDKGQYPETLAAWPEALAPDPLTGGPLRYERRADGSAVISVPGADELFNKINELKTSVPFTWELPPPGKAVAKD